MIFVNDLLVFSMNQNAPPLPRSHALLRLNVRISTEARVNNIELPTETIEFMQRLMNIEVAKLLNEMEVEPGAFLH